MSKTLTSEIIRAAAKKLKEMDAMLTGDLTKTSPIGKAISDYYSKGVIGKLSGVNVVTSPQTTSPNSTVWMRNPQWISAKPTGIFQQVEAQVQKYKRNVVSREVLKSKHEQYLAEVEKQVNDFEQTPEYKEWLTKAIGGAVKRAIMRELYTKEGRAIIEGCAKRMVEKWK